MTALVAVETMVLLVLVFLVASLLRSHATILRRLHELDSGVPPGDSGVPPGDGNSPSSSRDQPSIPLHNQEASAQACDVAGLDLAGAAVTARVAGVTNDTVLAFLSSGCLTCHTWWKALSDRGLAPPRSARLIIVTRGRDEETPSLLRDLAPRRVQVIQSTQAWLDYSVPGAPYAVMIDGAKGRVVSKGTAATLDQVMSSWPGPPTAPQSSTPSRVDQLGSRRGGVGRSHRNRIGIETGAVFRSASGHGPSRRLVVGSTLTAAGFVGAAALRRHRRSVGTREERVVSHSSRVARTAEGVRLGSALGVSFASAQARKVFASAERRATIDRELEMKTAEQVVATMGQMKGAFMKLGQMASFIDEGLPEPIRESLAQLQAHAPPMSGTLAAQVIEEELGAPPSDLFVEWDPVPIAAASIGQVHRALVVDPADGQEKAVAVKVQYPGVDKAIAADLQNTRIIGNVLRMMFKGLDPGPMVKEIRERVSEELDYEHEAANQRLFADRLSGHPFLHVPAVIDAFSSRRVLCTELATGATYDELQTWSQAERDLAAEAIFRFVFRCLYRFRAFNGDPHPGNYLFRPGGHVTFLDYGLVKYFSQDEMDTFEAMIQTVCLDYDWEAFRAIVEEVGLLRPGAPVTTDQVAHYFGVFYESVFRDEPVQWEPEYSTRLVRTTFDARSPVAQWASVPAEFVIIQRINLGLVAILGHLHARGNYRRIAEELWTMVNAPPSTPLGELEAAWLSARGEAPDPAPAPRD